VSGGTVSLAMPTERAPALGNPAHAHLYSVGVMDKDGKRLPAVEVVANNRAQAASIAKRHGYQVADVNMIG
jgi:hypothetical protein